jgi:hypothetical protein
MHKEKVVPVFKRNAMTAYGKVEVELRAYLISTLGRGEWSVSHFYRFKSGERLLISIRGP